MYKNYIYISIMWTTGHKIIFIAHHGYKVYSSARQCDSFAVTWGWVAIGAWIEHAAYEEKEKMTKLHRPIAIQP